MERGERIHGSKRIGLTSLAMIIRNHAQALEFDLMTMTGRTLSEYMGMGAAGKAALVSFTRYLPPDSATYREMHPRDELGGWLTTAKTNAILADIYDAFAIAHSKKGHRPKPYPRPNGKGKGIGKGAIPVNEFMDWWKGN